MPVPWALQDFFLLQTVKLEVYDAWGKPLAVLDGNGTDVSGNATHIANVNPFRYRGYRYDTESGLYYLNSRYYNPETCRMLNADSMVADVGSIQGYNLFAYCDNNPVNNFDPSGHWKLPNLAKFLIGAVIIGGLVAATVLTGGVAGVIIGAALTGAIVSGVTGAVVGGVIANATGGNVVDAVANGFMWGTICGAASGAIGASPLGIAGQIAANAAISTSAYVGQTKLDGGKVSPIGLAISIGGGALAGAIGGPGMMSPGTPYAGALALNAKTVLREARRANQFYAVKSIARSSAYVSSVAWRSLPGSFGRVAAGGVMGTAVGGTIPLFPGQ